MKAGVVLGVGLGGFVDGIVFHQIVQWHSMVSAVLPPTSLGAMRQGMLWDGVFHSLTWCVVLAGVYMLRSEMLRGLSGSLVGFTGRLVVGWGAFNLVEGVLDHHLLELHHVRDLPVHAPLYDWVFLGAGGFGLLAMGGVLMAVSRLRAPH